MAVEMPISCIDRFLLFSNGGPHSCLNPMVDTWGVGNDQRGPFMIFGFSKSFNCLIHICPQSNLSDVNITITHCQHTEIFFTNFLPAAANLATAAVGVDLE